MKLKHPSPSTSPTFSIIIPTLNEEFFLPGLLRCLSDQTYPNFEVIVVDGFSKDQTVAAARSFATKLNLKILTTPKRNVAHQRNLGGHQAVSDYLIFFDADTLIDADFFEILNDQLKSAPADLFTAKMVVKSPLLFDRFLAIVGNLISKYTILINQPRLPGPCIGCTKKLFLQVNGYNETFFMNEDHDFSSRAAQITTSTKLYAKPHFYVSLRRFKKDGYSNTLSKWFLAALHFTFNKNAHPLKFNYKMGGEDYDR